MNVVLNFCWVSSTLCAIVVRCKEKQNASSDNDVLTIKVLFFSTLSTMDIFGSTLYKTRSDCRNILFCVT